MPVCRERQLPSGEGGDEHEERGTWQVEVGQQAIHDRELVAGMDKEIGRARTGLQAATAGAYRCRFQRARGGGANGNHAAARGASGCDSRGSGLGNLVALGIDRVVFNVFNTDRFERARTRREA